MGHVDDRHPELPAVYARAIEILEIDPYNSGRNHPIRKLEGVTRDEGGQYRLRLGRFRFRYDIEPRTVVLAAQFAELALNADHNVWELRLRPETAFLWANVGSYQALGFTFDDPESEQRVRDALRAQSQSLGMNL